MGTMGLFLETKNYVFQGFAVSIDIILKVELNLSVVLCNTTMRTM